MAGVGGRANLPHAAAATAIPSLTPAAASTSRCKLAAPPERAASPGPRRGRDPFPPPLRCRPGKREEQSALPSPHPPTVAAAAAAAMSPMETRALRVQMSYNFLQ